MRAAGAEQLLGWGQLRRAARSEWVVRAVVTSTGGQHL